MTTSPGTHQVNLKLTAAHEEIVRDLVHRLRAGGPSYERLVRQFLLSGYEPSYMHLDELNLRFGRIDQRLLELEAELRKLKNQLPRNDLEAADAAVKKESEVVAP